MHVITMLGGIPFIIDDEDFEYVSRFTWHNMRGYPTHRLKSSAGCEYIRLSRKLLNAPSGLQVDHINGNPLDNRRSNLRLATHAQNLHNVGKKKHNSSGYLGVTKNGKNGWCAMCTTNKKRVYLGMYRTKEEAARAFDRHAQSVRGEFARLNFPN